jgi:hypothetical protein
VRSGDGFSGIDQRSCADDLADLVRSTIEAGTPTLVDAEPIHCVQDSHVSASPLANLRLIGEASPNGTHH